MYNKILCSITYIFTLAYTSHQSQSPFPCPVAHRAAPISISIALGYASANAVKTTAGGLAHWQLREFNFPTTFSYVERQTRRQ